MTSGTMTTNEQPTTASDEFWMEEALRAAQRALEAGEVPVGAVVVSAGKIVGRTQSAISVKIQRLEHLLWELSNYRIGFGASALILRLI